MASKKNLSQAATNVTSKFFGDENPAPRPPRPAKPPVTKKTKKKLVFSFRGNEDDVQDWRLYAKVSGMKVDDLGSAAMSEYLKNHPLDGTAKAFFDAKKKS